MDEDSDHDLAAIWLVFGDSYLNHSNAPLPDPDHREQVLVDLLSSSVKNELANSKYDSFTLTQLTVVYKLLQLWSEDLDFIYQLRDHNNDSEVRCLAQRFLQRIHRLENLTIIPNGLISALRTGPGHSESVSLGIIEKEGGHLNWIQVDPGSAYHQHCRDALGERSNAYLTITGINPDNVTEDLLYLLVGLKAVHPDGSDRYYEDLSLYECVLSQLNGKTVFQSEPDEDFIYYSHSSPVHIWQVVDKSFRCMLRLLLGDRIVDRCLVLNFKLFLMEKVLATFQDRVSTQSTAYRFLLHEMCRNVAAQALDLGDEEQKALSFQLISKVKTAIGEYWNKQEQERKLDQPHVLSLRFAAPNQINHIPSSGRVTSSNFSVLPLFKEPTEEEDIINYLRNFKTNCVEKLILAKDTASIAYLGYAIQVFLIDYLANTNILEKSVGVPFSRDDAYLAGVLSEFAQIYCGCQTKLVKKVLSKEAYQPQFYAKNVTIQFFVYAAVAALNLRNPTIGPILASYNLCVSNVSRHDISLDSIIPRLVMEDSHWVNILLEVANFFMPAEGRKMLFSSSFSFQLRENANTKYTDINFAHKLLQKYPIANQRFINKQPDIKNTRKELLESKLWADLAYTDKYLPPLYIELSKVANLAKMSLAGFPPMGLILKSSNRSKMDWLISPKNFERHNEYPTVKFRVNYYLAKSEVDPSDIPTRYEIESSTYQIFLDSEPENKIIATQDCKPDTMGCNQYMQLGFVQSEAEIKLERLYIALKNKQLDFSCKEESILIKQFLFEISLIKMDREPCSVLELTAVRNPKLIDAFGSLCIEKARAIQYCWTQHHAIGDILIVTLGLLTFYPIGYKATFIEGIMDIYDKLKETLAQPPAHLNDNTLLHLNAYLLIAVQAKPQILETDVLTVLKALVAIKNFKAKGSSLDNSWLLRVHTASFTWCSWVECQLKEDPTPLNHLMLSVNPDWDPNSSWKKSKAGLLFTCNNYEIQPLLGSIYFQKQQVKGLPDEFREDANFKECLGDVIFPVMPSSRKIGTKEVPCYLSVNRTPELRLTPVKNDLLIEEKIGGEYQRYIPAKKLLSSSENNNVRLLCETHAKGKLQHWLDKDNNILIKDKQRKIILKWDLSSSLLYSMEHEGYLAPWDQLQDSLFKVWLERVEPSTWIELIAKQDESLIPGIRILSLSFPRLDLYFNYKEGQFYSKQVHGYVISKQQNLNTLHGFCNYLILELEEGNLVRDSTKVIIPHRKVTPKKESFYVNEAIINHNEVRSPAYFVYDYDSKTGLLKGHHTRAHLYLALLYFRTASFDDHNASHCNAYHLARENLELCWKNQPYDSVELDIIEQLLDISAMQCFHSNLIALYLKVVSLLSSSLQLAFLFMDAPAQQNKKRAKKLLKSYAQKSNFLSIYLENKTSIFERIKLSPDEERDAKKHYPVSFVSTKKKCYNSHYIELFSKEKLMSTPFLLTFMMQVSRPLKHPRRRIEATQHSHEIHPSRHDFYFDTSSIDIIFSFGINRIHCIKFQPVLFTTLYNLAKSSSVSLVKYCYLLHHLLIKAEFDNVSCPAALAKMLARALLLVAENPKMFPEVPSWFNQKASVDMNERYLIKKKVFDRFGISWKAPSGLRHKELEKARKEAEREDKKENETIWALLAEFDLDSELVPRSLPENPKNFTLRYEDHMNFSSTHKRNIIREFYFKAAFSDCFYQFFASVLRVCDRLKHVSKIGLTVAPFVHKTITVNLTEDQKPQVALIPEPVSLEKWTIHQEPLIELDDFFIRKLLPSDSNDFLFESELEEPKPGYHHQFYSELKNSWTAYTNEPKCCYSWRKTRSVNKLESELRAKYNKVHNHAQQIWHHIETVLNQRSNTKSNNYFALRWFSGRVRHFNKSDLVRLLVEPHKLRDYNPDCRHDCFIEKLLEYVICEINLAKLVKVLALIEQYKKAQTSPEQFSILQGLVKSLKENVDPNSYRHPHWLLYQIENGIIVRENQSELIVAMLNQNEKAMYQLNMGEGKSSVILPLLSYSLANGKQLLRMNVLSPLLTTMKEFLCQRFSGLIRKHVYSLPFNRDTGISTEHLKSIYEALQTCQESQHFLLVTPEHRMCLQLKIRELLIENQKQIGANSIFNWKTYRQRAPGKNELYDDLNEEEIKETLLKQDQVLADCLRKHGFIDEENNILKPPSRSQGYKKFAQFEEVKNNSNFREWDCLKAAYFELLYNSKIAHADCNGKLELLNKIDAINAIDLFDESDEILKHGTELNYTVGERHMFSGGELRWKIPQFFIKAIFCDPDVKNVITAGSLDGFTTINQHFCSQGGVPFVQLLDESYYESSIKPLLIQKFFQESLQTLRKYQCSVEQNLLEGEASSLKKYIAGQLSLSTEKKVIGVLSEKGSLKDKLLIAKGWLSHGILYHAFNAKYRVQYGLNLNDQGETVKQIAIPFFGKDTPAPRSEFSHPDVMLGFTIISYLYQGLNQTQLQKAVKKLKSEYCQQVADANLKAWAAAGRTWIEHQTNEFPPALLSSVQHLDVTDEQCLKHIHLFLSKNFETIFFYLNHFVLLEEAMQYICKISANAHSLVGYNASLGFSGTDDRKITMPFEVKSLRSITQEGTNGKLLSVLTQERNCNYNSLKTQDTLNLLKNFCDYARTQPHCHALIDAGALVTGLSNYAVAEFFLAHLPSDFQGILYFSDDNNSLTVLTRDKKTTALQDCYLDKECLFIYLDDIHTRGTDLKLPLNCHAILTIGMGMQKDKLMQAAMRLRQLAEKQSVSLWGTQAVTFAIARDNAVDVDSINSLEVIKWVTRNTINNINADLFHVAVRKINFQFLKKAEAWLKEAPKISLNTLVQCCQEQELFRLEDFYALSAKRENLALRLDWFVSTRLRTFWQELQRELEIKPSNGKILTVNQSDLISFKRVLSDICDEAMPYLQSGFVHDSLDNDEEKEVEAEVVQEQQVEIEVTKRDECFEKEWDVELILREDFITSALEDKIIIPLHWIQRYVQSPADLKNVIWHKDIYMTYNYIDCVIPITNEKQDNYLRPVDVVLMHRFNSKSVAVLLSGKEASRIKSTCYDQLDLNLLIHLNDEIKGPTLLPVGSSVTEEEQKLLSVVKLFSGECNYSCVREVYRLAKLVGRLYPHYFHYFACSNISIEFSEQLFGVLIEGGYLDFAGVMTEKLLKILRRVQSEDSLSLNLPVEYESHNQFLLDKLYGIFSKLIITSSNSLKDNHKVLCQWIETRGRLKEFPSSALESILDSEYELKCSQ